ncbi:phytase [Crocosphaera subtropica ATCC 51142]|uniref:Phytase n=1 Tax=Crocosphaera subtropica (strain ATCC 51142 / BH68) TaxID=43989 RepID=B1WZU4_CROS5|nr:phytase [Crocosphaera subtropica]ACB52843.1 phytase [Crocosphaera subtropica ATCC 51142]
MIRFASFNASLNRNSEGELIADLLTPNNEQGQTVAEIIQRVNPDVILINEFDFDGVGDAAQLYSNNYLNVSQNGVNSIDYPYFYVAPSNTGIASGFDLDNNGEVVTNPGEFGYGNDAFGFGNFPGQFGMAVYSKYPIDFSNVRTFQTFLWKDMPDALLPVDSVRGESYYSEEELNSFRLSSKSHWDLPILIDGETVHFLVSHPTPPVFDGEEDRNGRRNHDEIRFWSDYITPGKGGYIYDDQGNFGGLKVGEKFVIAGDQNADPFDGDSVNNAINQLLDNPYINTSVTPESEGGVDASNRQGGVNDNHIGDPKFDTADFNDNNPGNLRVDYVLPSENLEIKETGVFWPTSDDPLFDLVGNFPFPSSDHRLVYTDVNVKKSMIDSIRKTVQSINFIGEVNFPTGLTFEGTEFGGISGLVYDHFNGVYYGLSDDRSQLNDARFYSLNIDLSDGILDGQDITFNGVTTLLDEDGNPFINNRIDPEGIALTSRGTLFISSEGNANTLLDPFVNEFSLSGQQFNTLPVPSKFLPIADQSSGIRNNQAFESLTITPDERYLYTAVENALWQDGINSTLENESAVRILQYDLKTGEAAKEFLYFTAPIPNDSNPSGGFADNGLVELLAIDNTGTFLALERSFAAGVGNNIRLYQVNLQGATDISQFDSLAIDPDNPNDGLFDVDSVAQKRLLIDFDELGITLDNSEALAFGPTLPNGNQSLIVVSDNNFNDSQFTQFLAFELDINSIPFVTPTLETPSEIRYDDPTDSEVVEGSDSDDPAIYIHPDDVEQSLVITALKNGGLAVYDLDGNELQKIAPDNIRYNNVDLVYGFNLDGESIDIAVVSDRRNDTLVIFEIDPTTQQLTDITSPNILESIFGVDDGEATAYGLATYTSPVTGEVYTFVSQADGDQIAQLKLISDGQGNITAEIVRTLSVPIPDGGEVEDAQVEGMVVDRELGYLYVGQEGFGIWKFYAEPNSSEIGTIVDTVKDINPDSNLTADVEGLTIYYGEDGQGYLLASSQGDSSFAVYDRQGSNSYLGNFVVGENNGIDGVEESDGADIINVALGDKFPKGLLVVHDGSNENATVFQDPEDREIQNFNTNFKYIDLEDLSATLPFFKLNTKGYDPRNPVPNSLINGIASGDTTQNSTVLWARSTFTGDVTIEYSTDANFSSIIATETLTVTDPTLPVKVEIENLTPNTQYYYRVTDAAKDTAIGEFKTSAELGTNVGLTFGVSGDWRGELAPYPAIANASDRDLDFFVEHGDTIYADIESDAVKNPDGTRKQQAETIEEYRAKHSEVYDSRFGFNFWEELRANTSILATIDDHEVINDFAGGANADTDDRFSETEGLINDTELFENGMQTFQEYNPLRDEFYGDVGDERFNGERKLYRYSNYGSDAAVFVLDTRSFRDDALEGPENFLDTGDRLEVLNQSLTQDRTLLGSVQLADLKQDLLDAENNGITWKFVMVPEPMQNIFPGINTDAFEGYGKERTEILKFINENSIDNVVFVAADVHTTFVNNLTYQEEPEGEQIATNAFEITTGAVAFEQPTGEILGNLFTAGNASLQTFYDSLPIAPDTDDLPNDKDDFVKQAINNVLLNSLGFDPLGLNNNLPQAEGLIDATLIQGDYFVGHTYGWTEFDIDPETQQLKVITYGIEAYSEDELLADIDNITSRQPKIVSEFVVNSTVNGSFPKTVNGTDNDDFIDSVDPDNGFNFNGDNQILFAGLGNDFIDVTFAPGNNIINLEEGDDIVFSGSNNTLNGGEGKDTFFVGTGGGNNTITGGENADDFVIVTDEQDLPIEPNIITDFNPSQGDKISLLNTSFDYSDRGSSWNTIQDNNDTVITVFDQRVAILKNTDADSLTSDNFFFSNTNNNNNNVTPITEEENEPINTDNSNATNSDPIIENNDPNNIPQSDDQGELFDLREFVGRQVQADFLVSRSASYNNFIGFYEIDDLTGRIDGLTPGEEGYQEAALSRQVSAIGLQVEDNETANITEFFTGGSIYAPFMIVKGTPETLRKSSSIYFPFLGANKDNKDRVRLLAQNVFGFEDSRDFDYNDLIVETTLTVI